MRSMLRDSALYVNSDICFIKFYVRTLKVEKIIGCLHLKILSLGSLTNFSDTMGESCTTIAERVPC